MPNDSVDISCDFNRISVLYEDACLLVLSKPSGLAVHRDEFSSRRMPTCVAWVRDQFGEGIHPVHRLDAATSGVLVFAKQKDVLAKMGEQFMSRNVDKAYLCVMRGWMKDMVRCELPMKREQDQNIQEATTVFKPLKRLEMPWANERFAQSRYTFAEVFPLTGRFHQIRRHANYLAFPLVGDTKHGDSEHNRIWRRERKSHRLLLHASSLRCFHPLTGESMQWQAPLPEDFRLHLEELPWQ